MTEPIKHTVEEEAGVVNTIILWRIYDVLSVLLSNVSPSDWESVMQAHDQGIFITPAPKYTVGKEDE